MRSSSLAVFACLSKVCAPPPAGKGGSLPSTGGAVPAHEVRNGQIYVHHTSTSSIFDDELLTADQGKIKANRAISSHLGKDPAFSDWVERNIDKPVMVTLGGKVLDHYLGQVIGLPLLTVVQKRDATITNKNAARYVVTLREFAEAIREQYKGHKELGSVSNAEAVGMLLARMVIDSWANSATNTTSLVSQLAAASVHKTSMTALKAYKRDEVQEVLADLKGTDGKFLQEAVIRAEYAATQEWFRQREIGSITVYRGMTGVGKNLSVGDTVKVSSNPLSSWSTSRKQTALFASLETTREDFGNIIIAMEVPVKAVQSIPYTGRGCYRESEVVLINKPATALVTDTFDSWQKKSV